MRFSLFVLRIMVNALSIVAAVRIVDGITFEGQWWTIIMVGAVFGFVNALIKPITKLLAFPLILLSLGLFTLVINAGMLTLTAALSGVLGLGLRVDGFGPAFWGALVVSIVSMVLWGVGRALVPEEPEDVVE